MKCEICNKEIKKSNCLVEIYWSNGEKETIKLCNKHEKNLALFMISGFKLAKLED